MSTTSITPKINNDQLNYYQGRFVDLLTTLEKRVNNSNTNNACAASANPLVVRELIVKSD